MVSRLNDISAVSISIIFFPRLNDILYRLNDIISRLKKIFVVLIAFYFSCLIFCSDIK